MINRSNLFDGWKKAMLPLCFTFSSLVNIVFYYLGLAFQENPAREYGFILLCVTFAVCSGLTLLYTIWKEQFSLKTWLLLCGTILFYGACFLVGLTSFGTGSLLFEYLLQFIVFCLPALFIGICAAKWRTDRQLIPTLEKLGFLVLPAAVMYLNQVLFNANPFNYGRDLGIINYMSFAYTLMPFLLAHILQFVDGADFELPLLQRTVRHSKLVRLVMILIYWIVIYSSGTRGTVVCVLCFCLFLGFLRLLHRQSVTRTALVSGLMLLTLIFNLYVYAPAGMRWLSRMDIFLDGLSEGKLVTSTDKNSIPDNIDEMVSTNPNRPTETIAPTTKPTTPDSATDVTKPESSDSGKAPTIRDRGTLYKIAIKEFLKSPITGMKPGGYSDKYHIYPHNAILELLAETGLAGTLVMFLFVLMALKRLLADAWHDKDAQYFLLIIMAYAVRANISGTFWECSAVLCALGFAFAYHPTKQQVN